MTYPTYPELPSGYLPDSSKHSETTDDPAMRHETDGGHVITRARHTRKPRKSWKLGYTDISAADKDVLTEFYDEMRGGSRIFQWTNPDDGKDYLVRYKGAIVWTYKGIRDRRFWDCTFELEQA